MDSIYNSTSQIYESLIDRDFEELKGDIHNLMYILKDISSSIEDDI
tara:strand:+ start:1525 stop:1662 length:138 start_codon:yes stop_codon:yes gene_type:complete